VDAADVIESLGLQPHPEGGWYAETWRAPAADGERPVGTSIYFLLRAGEMSRWHRLDAPEIWHFHAGDPLELRVQAEGSTTAHRLGPGVAAGERPQAVVPACAWQTARSLGAWTLVGCSMAPGFAVEGFELAPDGWQPTDR
jgi:predicted cupin superfamily sugar epimerase